MSIGCGLSGTSGDDPKVPEPEPPVTGIIEIRQNDVVVQRGTVFGFDDIAPDIRLEPVVLKVNIAMFESNIAILINIKKMMSRQYGGLK